MKLYLKNYKPINILKKIKLIDDYYINTKNSIEIISDDGVFYVDNKRFYKINVILDKTEELKMNNLELLLDKSEYNTQNCHQLPFEHIITHVTTFYYSNNPKSNIKLVIEGNYETIDNKNVTNKYDNFNPINFYFDVNNEITNFELLNNDNLNVFLSLLN